MTGITDTTGAVVSGFSGPAALAGAGAGGMAVQTLHMNSSGTTGSMDNARMTPVALQQGNPYGVGVNVDYMA